MAVNKSESELHRKIKLWLADKFTKNGWKVKHIDGENDQTDLVINKNKVGDGEDKRPDVDAKDEKNKRVIRGEAKVDNGDFDSEHSITQFKLFSDRQMNGVSSWLIIGVPDGTKEKMKKILDKKLTEEQLKNVAVWQY